MVNPAWFFSTLAQAVAAIVGLLVSLSAIQYQLERQRRERRTEDLRQATQAFQDKFEHIIAALGSGFAPVANKSFIGKTWNMNIPGDDINLDIVLNSHISILNIAYGAPIATLYWAHLSRISNILIFGVEPSSDPQSHYLFSDIHFDRLRESTRWLDTHLDGRSILIESLYDDLEIPGNNHHVKDVFTTNLPGQSVQDWLQQYQSYASDQTTLLSGKNIQSYRRVAGELHTDFRNLDSLRANTIRTFDPNINNILYKSALLMVVGVFIPMISMISNIDGVLPAYSPFLLSFYEIVLFGIVLIITISLLSEIQEELGGNPFRESLLNSLTSLIKKTPLSEYL
jgi:hypothetical protein